MTEHNEDRLLTLDEARARLLALLPRLSQTECVATEQAAGRTLAEPVVAPVDVPPAAVSLLDGYAVAAGDLPDPFPAEGVSLPVGQVIFAGQVGRPLEPGEAARIFTGAPLPEGADAVVAQEAVTAADAHSVTLHRRLAVGESLRPRAADVQRGQAVFSPGLRLHPGHVAQLASLGLASVAVTRRPRVAVFTTGDELVVPGGTLAPGQIFNANHAFLLSALAGQSAEVIDLGQLPDDPDQLADQLARASEQADLVLTSGGVSVGEADHLRTVVAQLGSLDSWRVFLKPGKPLAFGSVNGTPFIGLPGNPVSTFVTFYLFVLPALRHMAGALDCLPRALPLPADFTLDDPGDRPEFMRVRMVTRPDGRVVLERFANQNSGIVSSLSWADALARVPEHTVVRPGDLLECLCFAELFS
ncbi:MAG: gephyrin-like molybdotransferase Glp [Halothiobacillaceae bacterium]